MHTPRWGTLDGPDDAIETFFNWTLLHALGGSDSVLRNYKKALDGHYKQYGELRTKLTKLAENGAYYKEFVTQSDWFHTGEGMRAFMFLGLSDPNDADLSRAHEAIRRDVHGRGSRSAELRPEEQGDQEYLDRQQGSDAAQGDDYDWVGDPVPGSFHLLHNKAGRHKLLDLNAYYPKMLAHCEDYWIVSAIIP